MLTSRTSFQVNLVLLAIFFLPAVTAEVPGPELDVDDHWLDLYQDEDEETFQVEETIWFNNTDDHSFTGKMYAWLPADVTIFSVCVREGTFSETCMMPKHLDANLIEFDPFIDYTTFLTHYGQVEHINITAADENATVKLAQQVVLKYNNSQDPVTMTLDNLTLASEKDTLEAILGNNTNIPKNITLLHNYTFENEGDTNRTLNLSIENLPEGWRGWLFDDEGNTTTTLAPGQILNLTLHMQVPSYLMKIKIEYKYIMVIDGDKQKTGQFYKELLYPTRKLEAYAFANIDTVVTMNPELKAHFFGPYTDQIYMRQWDWYFGVGTEQGADNPITISFSWEKKDDTSSGSDFDWTWLVALMVIAIIFGIPMLHRSGLLQLGQAEKPEEDELDGLDEFAPSAEDLTKNELADLRAQFQLGNISQHDFTDQEWALKEKLSALEREGGKGQ